MTTTTTTKEIIIENRSHQQQDGTVWHRRTGGGSRLFVEYYAGQPYGVVMETSSLVCPEVDGQEKKNQDLGGRTGKERRSKVCGCSRQ